MKSYRMEIEKEEEGEGPWMPLERMVDVFLQFHLVTPVM